MKVLFANLARRLIYSQSAVWILLLGAVWLLMTAGLRPLMLPDEGRYLGVSWEMLQSGNWLVPTLDGLPFFHKPPLFYWLSAFGLQLFGPHPWAGRLASLLPAMLAVAGLFAFLRKYGDKPLANLTLAVLLTQPFFFLGAQFANLDTLVAAMISLTIVAGGDAVLSLERGLPYRRSLTATYVFAALGVLAKGLIGIVLPGAILLAWIVLRRKFRLIPALLPWYLILLFFALAAPWFWWMEKSYPGFWDYFFIYHHFRRFAETGFNNQQAFWFYVPVLLLFTLPWSPWIVRLASRRFATDSEHFARRSLMVLWVLGIVVFFSLPKSKLVGYILPALPAFACLLADGIWQWLRRREGEGAWAWLGLCLSGAILLCLGLVLGIARHDISGLRHFATEARQQPAADEPIVMLDEYQYDLPFYLQRQTHPWVVSDWSDPTIPKNDNWRKELYDAGQFAPAHQAEVLISPAQFLARACAEPQKVFWLWGRVDLASRYAFVDPGAQVFAHGEQAMWRLDGPTRARLKLCDGKPSNG